MQLFRLDAEHELSGSLTRFYQLQIAAQAAGRSLEAYGWCCDVYAVELPISPQTAQRLKAAVWPNADDDALLTLAGDPTALARADLERIVALSPGRSRE